MGLVVRVYDYLLLEMGLSAAEHRYEVTLEVFMLKF
jgi:hypothetical protein